MLFFTAFLIRRAVAGNMSGLEAAWAAWFWRAISEAKNAHSREIAFFSVGTGLSSTDCA